MKDEKKYTILEFLTMLKNINASDIICYNKNKQPDIYDIERALLTAKQYWDKKR